MGAVIPIQVLYVEDDPIVGRAICRMLRPDGFEVEHVSNLEEAEVLTKVRTFDTMLLDLGLPGSTGSQTVRRARALTSIPIVVFTGQAVEPDDRLALEVVAAGADFYIEKGSDTTDVRRALRLSLMRKQLNTAVQGRNDICGRIIKFERDGALVCYCVRCDKVLFLVESNIGSLVCPHCNQRTLMQWGQAQISFKPELPAKFLEMLGRKGE
jgi:DNA-binding response OmpR family regulator